MTTLFYSPGACSLAVHITLEWIGAPYEAVRVKTGSAELKAVNPTGAVPALREEDGWVLTQAGAILEYLAARHAGARLDGGGDLRSRAELHRWCSFMTSDLHAAFWPVFMPGRYTTDPSETAQQAVMAAGLALVRKQFAVLDAHLAGREWILNGGPSVADAYAFPMIRWGKAKLKEGFADFPNLQALHDRLAADPAVQRVLERESG